MLHFKDYPNVAEDVFSVRPMPPRPDPLMPDKPLVNPDAWRTLPAQLDRPTLPDIDLRKIVALRPEFAGLTAAQVRDAWPWVGYKAMGLYQRLWVDPPKSALPPTYNVIMKDLGLATCSTHLFGVYRYIDGEKPSNPTTRQYVRWGLFRRQVYLYPTHGVIWVAYCANLPEMHIEDVPTKLVNRAPGKAAASVIRLPIVPLALPYPERFMALQVFVYTRVAAFFVHSLLPVKGNRWMVYGGGVNEETLIGLLISEYGTKNELCRLLANVHQAYDNMRALLIVDLGMWDALQVAWRVVRNALKAIDPIHPVDPINPVDPVDPPPDPQP